MKSTSLSHVLGVIPARYGSTRLPAKPLAIIHGRPMIEWVWRAAKKALANVVVATDDRRILKAVQSFGGDAMMTPVSCASGTDRMAAVAHKKKFAYYVNIQGDEPSMQAPTIRDAARLAVAKKAVATSATSLEENDFENPNVVKVVVGDKDRAIYFSRSLIPFPREQVFHVKPLKHLGIYAYPRAQLMQFVKWKPVGLELTERLEQLRALHYGMPIYVARTQYDSIGVDTAADLKEVIRKMGKML